MSDMTGIELAASIRESYRHYVAFHSELELAEAGTLALWTMHTYLFDLAETTPYILVVKPTSSAGGSRIFDVAKILVHKPEAFAGATGASLFYSIDMDHPTLLFDEADMITESRDIRQVLNAGCQPGMPIKRVHKRYDVFCPKAFVGIAGEKPPLTAATLTRCIQIPMRRIHKGKEHAARFYARQAARELGPIRAALEDWALSARTWVESCSGDRCPRASPPRSATGRPMPGSRGCRSRTCSETSGVTPPASGPWP